ncbi:radical SAM protein [Desulfogranum japonicum]|uniref:radical SAM protein n=1 Tax=Desulfogranum japonicum TaxID=231447 RepID=UPI00048E2F9A|nr:radical SAM protein [Desulfogranum japonicum]
MNCEILHILYVKSNGEILCNDDFGERIVLGHVDTVQTADDVSTLFCNEQYTHIRDSFLQGVVPWPDICEHCAFLRRNDEFTDHIAHKHIIKLQLEPTLLCNLNCRCCSNDVQIQTRKKPHIMAPETYERFLRALHGAGFRIDNLEYCGQGEPLLHPKIGELLRITHEVYPNAWQRVITNGNVSYSKTLQGTPVDEVMVAGDGVWQRSYEQYRVQGQVDKVLRFMADAVADKQLGKPLVIWKYILFEFNDSNDELIDAQHKAQEIGVDSLLFVVTHSEFHSRRYPMEELAKLPIIIPQVATNAHPSFFDGVQQGVLRFPILQAIKNKLRKQYRAQLDEALLFPGNLLQLRGWTAATEPVKRILLYLDGEKLGEVVPTDLRPDVEEVFATFRHQPMGFRLSAHLGKNMTGACTFQLESYGENGSFLGQTTTKCIFMPYTEPGME